MTPGPGLLPSLATRLGHPDHRRTRPDHRDLSREIEQFERDAYVAVRGAVDPDVSAAEPGGGRPGWGAEYWLARRRDGDPRYLRAFERVFDNA